MGGIDVMGGEGFVYVCKGSGVGCIWKMDRERCEEEGVRVVTGRGLLLLAHRKAKENGLMLDRA